MDENGVTVAEALGAMAEENHEYWMHYRAALFDQIAAVERHRLGMSVTTADKLFWLKRRGPKDEIIGKQVVHIRSCEKA